MSTSSETITFEFESDGAKLVDNPDDKKAIHGYTSKAAHDDWHAAAHDFGTNVTAMLEVLSPHLYDIFGDPEGAPSLILKRCRAIEAGRLRRS